MFAKRALFGLPVLLGPAYGTDSKTPEGGDTANLAYYYLGSVLFGGQPQALIF